MIAVCGENPGLFERLAPLEARAGGGWCGSASPTAWRRSWPASDLLVTKPGPGSLSEAFHQRVPVVVTRNVHTIPQERFNTDLVRDRGLGLVVPHWREIPAAVLGLFRDAAARAAMRDRIAALPANRAVYEVIDVIAREAGVAPSSHQ